MSVETEPGAPPMGHLVYEEGRDGKTLTFSRCDEVPNVCPEFHPMTGDLINIFEEDAKSLGLLHMITCPECLAYIAFSETLDPVYCWCPCRCGCEDKAETACGKLLDNGLCFACNEGKHEVPPAGVKPGVEEWIPQLRSLLTQFEDIAKHRSGETP